MENFSNFVPNQTKPNQTKPNQTKPNQTKLLYCLMLMLFFSSDVVFGQTIQSCDWYQESADQSAIIFNTTFGPSNWKFPNTNTRVDVATRKYANGKIQVSNICDERTFVHLYFLWNPDVDPNDEISVKLHFQPDSYLINNTDNFVPDSQNPKPTINPLYIEHEFTYTVPSALECTSTGERISTIVLTIEERAMSSLGSLFVIINDGVNEDITDINLGLTIEGEFTTSTTIYHRAAGNINLSAIPNIGLGIINYLYIEEGAELSIDIPWEIQNFSFWPDELKRSVVMADEAKIKILSGKDALLKEVIISTCNDNTNDRWDQILIEDEASLILENCVVRQGTDAIIAEEGSTLEVTNTLFSENITGMVVYTEDALVEGSHFINHQKAIVLPVATSELRINTTEIQNSAKSGIGIEMKDNAKMVADEIKVESTNIGISVLSGGAECTLTNSELNENNEGLRVNAGHDFISQYNLSLENVTAADNTNNGFYFGPGVSIAKFESNNLTGNHTGVTVFFGKNLSLTPINPLNFNTFSDNVTGVNFINSTGCDVSLNQFNENNKGVIAHSSTVYAGNNQIDQSAQLGVHLRNDRASAVRGNWINDTPRGIFVERTNAAVKNTRIISNEISAMENGVLGLSTSNLWVQENDIVVSPPGILNQYGGVVINESNFDRVALNQIEGSRMHGGIMISNGNGGEYVPSISENNILLIGNNFNTGVYLPGSYGVDVVNNYIEVGVVSGQGESVGVATDNTFASRYECNTVYNALHSMRIRQNSMGLALKGNELKEYSVGFDIIRSMIGEQRHHGNFFHQLSTNYLGIRGVGTENEITFSRFFVDGNANPLYMPANYTPQEIVVEQDSDNSTFECDLFPSPFSSYYNWVNANICDWINRLSTMQSQEVIDPLRIQHYREYLKRLVVRVYGRDQNNYPNCVKVFMNNLTKDEKDRQSIINKFEDLALMNDTIQGVAAAAYSTAAQAYVAAIEGNNSTQMAYWRTEMSTHAQQLDTVSYLDEQIADLLDEIEEDILDLDENDDINYLYKRVWLAQLSYMKDGELSTAQTAELLSIASLCSELYGAVVWKARSYVSHGLALYDDSDCNNTVPRGRIAAEASSRLSIYPNPSGQWINITGIDNGESYKITDIYGRIMKQGTTVEGQPVDISQLESGVYILQGAKSEQSQKFIKIQ